MAQFPAQFPAPFGDSTGTDLQVTFGGVSALNIVQVDGNGLTCEPPPGLTPGAVDVVVTYKGVSVQKLSGYLYEAPSAASGQRRLMFAVT